MPFENNMSQLNSLNQTQQAQANSTAIEAKTIKASTVQVTTNIANNLQGTFKLQGIAAPITQQLTMAQASQLSQPLTALVKQQSALIFLQSQASTATLTLPAVLQTLTQQWLNQDKELKGKIPAELAKLLQSKLGLTPERLTNQLLNIQLKQNLLQLSFLQGEPITELKLGLSTTQQSAEQVEQLLQFMLPIKAQDDASVFIQQQTSQNTSNDENKLRFNLQFDLDRLGKLEVQVELMEFELTTVCICDSPLLQRKVKQYWPQLEARLSALGFSLDNQIKQKNKLEQNNKDQRPAGLINVKV